MKALVIVEDDLDSRLWLRNLPDVPRDSAEKGQTLTCSGGRLSPESVV